MKVGETIYLDHQATTPVDPRVFVKMAAAFTNAFGNPHASEHVIGWRATEAIAAAARQVASLVGADPDEVIFTSGATEANNLALLGLADYAERSGRHRVLLSAIEHKSVLAAGRVLAQRHGLEVAVIEVDRQGRVDEAALAAQLDGDVLLVSIMAVNNEIGTIQAVDRIGALARAAGALVHCDAAQAPCAIDIGDLAHHADLISLSSHKIYGPGGIGALVVHRGVQPCLTPLIHGGGQQNGLRSGTLPLPLCVGFGAAAELLSGTSAREERDRVRACRDLFVETLLAEGCEAVSNGPDTRLRHPGNANLLLRSVTAADLLAALQPTLAASSGSACASGIPEPSHVLRAIGLTSEEADCSIRFSLGRSTTADEAVQAARIVSAAVERLSSGPLRATL
ncbi:cysteine sulfinate desulfinase [Novosphingobium sp. PC22D]|uniref:cysteine desulfurase family protein n=1 Tax=Novosphingobium sp. PC22D TaxID=1962403 RepID=UPI000BF1A72E|nr:cysteine desulfurase family protein [Novosphingobium sp. PC22D]PEQ12565.1 cysteine sulfinate desulfinase [Novosphingobium sp. PC22D]